FQRFNPEVEVIFRHYQWPGNVRQLQNVVRNIVVLHDEEEVQKGHLPPPLDQALNEQEIASSVSSMEHSSPSNEIDAPIRPLATVEREVIEHAINLCDGNIPKAAGLLEVSPSTIYRKKQGWDNS
ncbi:MAG: helix-turn-helix domain-containing protein, partial [Pseudomonadota bacterium]